MSELQPEENLAANCWYAGYNVEMGKIDTKIKTMPLSSFRIRKCLNGQGHDVLAVNLNFKWGLLS